MSQLLVLIILIFCNAFFAAVEIAFISLNDMKIDKQAKEGDKKAKSIKKMLKNPSKFLATIQIGITLAGFLSSAFASDAFADDLAPFLAKLIPVFPVDVWNHISIIIITIILSYFTLIFGELVPKRVAMKYSEPLAYVSVGIIRFISIITAPFVRFLTFSTDVVSKLFGASGNEEETVTEEEIRMMIDVGEEKGSINKDEREMIENVFEFNDKLVSEIMVPRTEIFALEADLSVSDAIEEITADNRFSRMPVYEETLDKIKGIVYVKDIVTSLKNKRTKIKSLVKEAYYVSELSHINDVFKELRKSKKQIAIVLDEHGGTAGIVTMEDIVEELVGEIYDEYDVIEKKYEKLSEDEYMIEGELPVYEVEKILDISIPEGEYDTLSGYLISKLNRIPNEKEKPIIDTEDVSYQVMQFKDNRITKVKATKHIKKIDEDDLDNDEDKKDEDDLKKDKKED